MNGRRNWLVRIGAVPGALALLATALVGCAPARSAHGANTRAPVGGGTATAQGAPAAHGGAAGSASARASASTGTTRAATRTPTASRRTTKPSFPTASRPSASSALAALDRLTVAPSAPLAGYSRAAFGSAWTDNNNSLWGHNGCDTRNDVLARDLTKVTFKPGTRDCVVASGTINEPYTGTVGAFARGEGAVCHQARYCSSNLQIDHVVALADAWQSGARDWPTARRVDFANDPLELLAADGPANESKGDADASGWLPANQAFDCRYVALQVAVKAKYGLTVTGAEKRAMTTVLTRCPSERLPTEPGGRG